jgi:hypothetical protein
MFKIYTRLLINNHVLSKNKVPLPSLNAKNISYKVCNFNLGKNDLQHEATQYQYMSLIIARLSESNKIRPRFKMCNISYLRVLFHSS